MRKIAMVNIAGGVGKTTTCINLGAALGARGYRVLVVDADPQGNSTSVLGTEAEAWFADALVDPAMLPKAIGPSRARNVSVVHGSMETAGAELMLAKLPHGAATRLRKGLRAVEGDYDYALLDAPPAPGILTINCIAACDEIIVPIETLPKALEGVGIMHDLIGQIAGDEDLMPGGKPPITYLACRYDSRARIHKECLQELKNDPNHPAFKTVIRVNSRVAESYLQKQSVIDYEPKSHGAKDYIALAEEYLSRG